MWEEQPTELGTQSDVLVRGRAVTVLHYGKRVFEGSEEQKILSELLSEVYRRTQGKATSARGEKTGAL